MSIETAPVDLFSAPFTGIITQKCGDQWTLHPKLQHYLTQEEAERMERKICAHDLMHSMRSTQSGLVLLDMLQSSGQTLTRASKIQGNDIAFVLHTHDVGYGVEDAQFVDIPTEVIGHEKASWEFVQNQTHHLSFFHPSRRYIARHQKMLRTGIVGTEKRYTDIIQAATEKPTINNLFLLLIAAADKADYFIRQRVDHLDPPQSIEANPYHALAYAVDNYHLEANHTSQTLIYHAQLHHDTHLSIDDPVLWRRQVEEDYSKVFALLRATAELAGYKFVVDVK